MKWPWVSRYRLEETQQRLETSEQERTRLLDLLLEGAAPRRELARAVEAAEVNELDVMSAELNTAPANEEQGKATAFSTPFDSMQARFRNTFKGGQIPAQFKARVH